MSTTGLGRTYTSSFCVCRLLLFFLLLLLSSPLLLCARGGAVAVPLPRGVTAAEAEVSNLDGNARHL
jgi:hypothetical protein